MTERVYRWGHMADVTDTSDRYETCEPTAWDDDADEVAVDWTGTGGRR